MPDTIDMIDPQLLRVACPETPTAELTRWADPLKHGCRRFGIDTVREIAALLAQAGHESCGFTRMEEGLFYKTADRLCQVWPSRFPTAASATPYCRNPEALANKVYANRMGNGPPESGDGYRFRGYGPFQLTGRDNHTAFGDAIGMPVDDVAAYIRTPIGGALSACWFFKVNGLERLAATPGVEDETRRVNGGTHGLADRTARFNRVVTELLRRGA